MTNYERRRISDEARSWLGTPYHHMGRLKGIAADCAMFPLMVYHQTGVIPDLPEIEYYPIDWHLHRTEERYLSVVGRYAQEVQRSPLPADFVVFKFGRAFSHGAIVIEWPQIIHAVMGCGVILSDAEKDGALVGRERKIFAPFGDESSHGKEF